MESGRAYGAMARWRILHEINVVITLIAEHGDELAGRYLAHEIVESARALAVYDENACRAWLRSSLLRLEGKGEAVGVVLNGP